ncbi:MAG: hypothetical protein KDA41_10955, partial [Planctomycetales bacterium]|nr:hypothetical protein [Planctomycetales bacterium]
MIRLVLLTLIGLLLAGSACGAEVHLRRDCQCESSLVRLGDVADVFAADEAERAALADIELFPAPAAGRTRLVRSRDVQELLAQRG